MGNREISDALPSDKGPVGESKAKRLRWTYHGSQMGLAPSLEFQAIVSQQNRQMVYNLNPSLPETL